MLSQYSDKNVIKLSGEDTVSRAIGAMKENGIKEIIVESPDTVHLVDPHRILQIRHATKNAKLKSIMYPAPSLSPTSDMIDAIKLIIENGLDAIPIKDRGKISGLVTESGLMKELLKDKQFGGLSADEVMTRDPILIREGDKLSKARSVFVKNNIEHLPVIDKSGNLVGILYEKDLMKVVLHEDDDIPQMNRVKKASPWSATVKDILNPNVAMLHYKDMIRNATKSANFESCVVVIGEEEKPVGIITPKDVLELVDIPKAGTYVQIAGMQDEDGFEKKEAHAEVDRTVQKLAATVDIERVLIHVKRYSEKGRVKYSIRTKLVTHDNVYTSHAWDWSIIRAVGAAMKILEKQVLKDKSKRLDERKHGGKPGAKKKPAKAKRKR